MPAQRTSFKVPLSDIIPTVGTWALTVASNIARLSKAAAATVSVMYIPISVRPEFPHARAADVKAIDVEYTVATANLTSAPTAVLSKVTMNETTGVRSRTTIAGTLAFAGTDTVGSNQGTYVATFTPSSVTRLEDNEELWLELTMNEAATSVLTIGTVRVKLG